MIAFALARKLIATLGLMPLAGVDRAAIAGSRCLHGPASRPALSGAMQLLLPPMAR